MKEIALHILDIAQNSVNAGASLIEILINEQESRDKLVVEIRDNGKGMSKEVLKQVNNPFFTTGKKKTGMGIPLLQQHAEAAGGRVEIKSMENEGTAIRAEFGYKHIDRQPMGDIASTLISLIRGYVQIDWVYQHKKNGKKFILDTREVKKELEGLEISNPQIIEFLKTMIVENLDALKNK